MYSTFLYTPILGVGRWAIALSKFGKWKRTVFPLIRNPASIGEREREGGLLVFGLTASYVGIYVAPNVPQ
jgi:hypothetical protein